jgi:glycosyltransferase involved in cell wall biosynthesis
VLLGIGWTGLIASVAIVAWYFPPSGGAGAQRPLHFARGLRSLGMRVRVLTPKLKGLSMTWAPADSDLEEAASGLDVRRIGTGSLVADTAGFMSGVIEDLHCDPVDSVVVTMSPFALADLVLDLRDTRARVVLDLRDPWALDSWPGYRTKWHWWREFRKMKESLLAADGFIMNTPDAMRAVLKAMPVLAERPHTVIPNGWAAADFQGEWTPPEDAPLRRGMALRIVHSGTLHDSSSRLSLKSRLASAVSYEPQWIDRSGRGAGHLLEAVRLLVDEGFDIRCEFLGMRVGSIEGLVARLGLKDRVDTVGYVPHGTAIQAIRSAGALFLPLGGLRSGDRSLIVPGKTYEYLVAGPPVVAALPEGDARDLAEMSDHAFPCDPCDAGEVAQAIRSCVSWWQARDPRTHLVPEAHMLPFERGALTRRLHDFLGGIVN